MDKLDTALRILSDNYVSMNYSLNVCLSGLYLSEKIFFNILHLVTSGSSHHNKEDI